MNQPELVLVRPQLGENIGAAARAMRNFGVERLRLVAPRDGWPNPAAVALASGAGRVLDEARVHETLAEALADATFVIASTARSRELSKPVLDPERAMKLAVERAGEGEKVAILFGPERAGLENRDIAHAHAIVSVPTNPDFFSLNLAQCVLLVCYEYRKQMLAAAANGDRAADSGAPSGMEWEGGEIAGFEGVRWADGSEMEALARHYEERLEEAGFFHPPEKAPGMKVNLRNLWSRMRPTRAEVQMLHGILRQMVRWRERASGGKGG